MDLADSSRSSSSPASHRLKSRFSSCFPCCFPAAGCEEERPPPSLIRSSTTWVRSKAKELPEFGGSCKILVAMIKRHHNNRRRRRCNDFRYDPLSYAQNFDEGLEYVVECVDGAAAADYRYRNFSSRLPATPAPLSPRPAVSVT